MIVGIDVAHIDRMRNLITRYPAAEERFFTARERAHCRSYADPALHFAGTFAAKEAVIKTLQLGRAVAWANRVEILRDRSGAPRATIDHGSKRREVAISISHDANVAIAVAVATPSFLSSLADAPWGSDFP